ncbi:MAG: hypothetical protein ACKO9F_01335, partial [Caldilinea sp.]
SGAPACRGDPCGRSWVSSGAPARGAPTGATRVVGRVIAVACAVDRRCHRGHPRCHPGHPPVGATLAVALVIAVAHVVDRRCHRGHPRCHRGHPPVGATRAVGHGCHRGHPQGVPVWSPVRSVVGVIGGTRGVILGTRKGCPYFALHDMRNPS